MEHDGLRRITSVSEGGLTTRYNYDENGNTVRKQDTGETDPVLFDYDAANQLVQARKGATLLGLYDYKADGLRIRHRNSGRFVVGKTKHLRHCSPHHRWLVTRDMERNGQVRLKQRKIAIRGKYGCLAPHCYGTDEKVGI